MNDADDRDDCREQHRAKARQLQQQKDATREQQDHKLAALEQGFQARLQQAQQQFAEQLTLLSSAIAVLQSQLHSSPLTEVEHDELRAAELRLETAQQQAQQQARQLQQLQQQHQKARQAREQADQHLEQSRKALHSAEQHLQQLHRQLSPEQGSLRHYLRLHYNGWEQKLGKVLDERLLERQDLQPHFSELSDSLYGLKVELTAIDTPDYAQDEAAIKHRIHAAEQQLQQASQNKTQAEKLLKEQFEQAELIRNLGCDKIQGFYFGRPMSDLEARRLFDVKTGMDINKLRA